MPATRTADLCEDHYKALVVIKERLKLKSKKRIVRNRADYEQVCAKVIELADSKPLFTGSDVMLAAKVKSAVANTAVRKMIEAGKIVATGVSAGRKLSKAS